MKGGTGLLSLLFAVATLTLAIMAFFEKEVRCCLALDSCDACPIVGWVPAKLRAKQVQAINQCPHAFALALRYEDSKGDWRKTGWQTIAPNADAYVIDDSHQPVVTYGASYLYAVQQMSSEVGSMQDPPPAKSSMKTQNIYNELSAWIDGTTRIKFSCER